MKDISIISNSLIVNELLKLIFKKREESISFIGNNELDQLSNTIVIVDDSVDDIENTINSLKLQNNRVILLGESNNNIEYRVDKPFLPEDIENIIEQLKEKPENSEIKTNILDPDEIAHIKALMDLEDDEEDTTLTSIECLEQKKSLKIKGKKAKELLLNLAELSPKEIKRLLKKSKISLKILYKDDNNA